MDEIKINNNNYYSAEDVYKLYPSNFPNCGAKLRNIIEVKNLDKSDYIYLKFDSKSKSWIPSSESYSRAKLFLNKKWVDKNNITNDETNDKVIQEPQIIELTLEEKLKDTDGNIMNIEIRGERNYDKCYFRLEDIVKYFNISDSINKTIINTGSGYEKELDYCVFSVNQVINNYPNTVKKSGQQKRIFLTYNGLIRMLYVSRSKQALEFQKWASQILFTHQFGTKNQKDELVSKLLGVPCKMVRDVCKRSISPISCVYLFTLGKVKQLREQFKISDKYEDDAIVVKYGRTENLEQRTGEHENDYGKMKGVDLKLRIYSYIDSAYVVDAENDLANFFKYANYKYNYPERNELAIIPKDQISIVEKEYDKIRKIYAGNLKEIISEKEKLLNELEIMKITHEKEIMKKDQIIMMKENELKLKDKDLEIYQLKLELSLKK